MTTIKDFTFDEAICLLQDLKERPGVEQALIEEGIIDIREQIPVYYDRYLTFLHDASHPGNAHLIREGYNPVHPAERPYNPALWDTPTEQREVSINSRRLHSCRAIAHV